MTRAKKEQINSLINSYGQEKAYKKLKKKQFFGAVHPFFSFSFNFFSFVL